MPSSAHNWFALRLGVVTGLGALGLVAYACADARPRSGGAEAAAGATAASAPPDRAAAGFRYITEGNYHGTGIPLTPLFVRKLRRRDALRGSLPDSLRPTRRTLPASVPFGYSAVVAANGTAIINANCFSCHASHVGGQFVLGLGNTNSIYQQDSRWQAGVLDRVVRTLYGAARPERVAYGHFGDYFRAVAATTRTPNPVVNPAFRLEEACVGLRNPADLTYRATGGFRPAGPVYASDVPPLWHVRKKVSLYYNGMGQGDKSKLLMQITTMGITDTVMARNVQRNFRDVVAWLESLRPPLYPGPINHPAAAAGQVLFAARCSGCHGTYGAQSTYPNKVVPLAVVETDPAYAQYFCGPSQLPTWYNASWFARSYPTSRLRPTAGYQAPPLDGIWATAPYLHNGAVPTLKALLDSRLRPTYWEYTTAYSYSNVGLAARPVTRRRSRQTYDTTVPGYGRNGHYFSDNLTDSQRASLLEYLKTL